MELWVTCNAGMWNIVEHLSFEFTQVSNLRRVLKFSINHELIVPNCIAVISSVSRKCNVLNENFIVYIFL